MKKKFTTLGSNSSNVAFLSFLLNFIFDKTGFKSLYSSVVLSTSKSGFANRACKQE